MTCKLAVTIGAYSLAHFVELNVLWIKRVFGEDVPILISDDKSPESPTIQSIAEKHGCHYYVSPERRFHFSGDYQSLLNSVAFAKDQDAQIACKISQRLIIMSGDILKVVDEHFADPVCAISLPGRPAQKGLISSPGFNIYPFLTDCMFLRASEFDPDDLKRKYESKLINSKNYWDSLVEFMVNDLLMAHLKGRYRVLNELTDHHGGQPKFLRRYQNRPAQYAVAAASVGLEHRFFQCSEWKQLEPRYDPRPRM